MSSPIRGRNNEVAKPASHSDDVQRTPSVIRKMASMRGQAKAKAAPMKSPLQQMLNPSVVERAFSGNIRVDSLLHAAFASDYRLCEALVPGNNSCASLDESQLSSIVKKANRLLEKDITVAQGTVSRSMFTPGKKMRHDLRTTFGWIARTALGTAFADTAGDANAPSFATAQDVVLTRLRHAFALLSGATSAPTSEHSSDLAASATSVDAAVDRLIHEADVHGVPLQLPQPGNGKENQADADVPRCSNLFAAEEEGTASEEPSSSQSSSSGDRPVASSKHSQLQKQRDMRSAADGPGSMSRAADRADGAQESSKESPSISARKLYAPTTFVEQHVPAAIAMLTCAHLWCTGSSRQAGSGSNAGGSVDDNVRISPVAAVHTVMECMLALLSASGIRLKLVQIPVTSASSATEPSEGGTATLTVETSVRALHTHGFRRDLVQRGPSIVRAGAGAASVSEDEQAEDGVQRKILRIRAITTHLTAVLECMRLSMRGFWPTSCTRRCVPPTSGTEDTSAVASPPVPGWQKVQVSAHLMQLLVDMIQEAASLLVPGTETSLLAENGFVGAADLSESQYLGVRLSPTALWMRTTIAKHYGHDMPSLVVALYEAEGDSTIWLPVKDKHGRVMWREHTPGEATLLGSTATSSAGTHGRAPGPVVELVLPDRDTDMDGESSEASSNDVLARVAQRIDRKAMRNQAVKSRTNAAGSGAGSSSAVAGRKRQAPPNVIPKGMDTLEWAETKRRKIAEEQALRATAGTGSLQPQDSLDSSSERAGRGHRAGAGAEPELSSLGRAAPRTQSSMQLEPSGTSAAGVPVFRPALTAGLGPVAFQAATGPTAPGLARGMPNSMGRSTGSLPVSAGAGERKPLDEIVISQRNARLAGVIKTAPAIGSEIVLKKGASTSSLPGVSLGSAKGMPTSFGAPSAVQRMSQAGPVTRPFAYTQRPGPGVGAPAGKR